MEGHMSRIAGLALLLFALLVAAPGAAQAATCKAPKYPGSGYFTSLKVTRVSCSTGKSVTLAFHKCRVKHGIKGHCTSRVRGYRCSEGKRQSISTEFNARVTCRTGSRRVVFAYQQNT
jgi:hypothetical protein